MNFIDFINLKGTCKTIAGQNIVDLKVSRLDADYPIIGKIVWNSGYHSPMKWNKEGKPCNLPLNHGLDLMAIVPKIYFEKINLKNLSIEEYNSNFKNV